MSSATMCILSLLFKYYQYTEVLGFAHCLGTACSLVVAWSEEHTTRHEQNLSYMLL